jgi:hypothetical protein
MEGISLPSQSSQPNGGELLLEKRMGTTVPIGNVEVMLLEARLMTIVSSGMS